ncbi:ribosomal-protein-alanine N-acetyltransferase [Natronincola peptidivorans]|uniref:Ribosomal-protein-alanine N-acetyltransferase n=1 Tax=Natronincola peptidivorans TaxID=426128 RepID=A0A1I0EDP0_9FIRM|nr:GNAT family N-acetyltransferase [Natronincola peptidivorans]SET42658.1 ribosomal-protein-alanine N-acetyltransferase [Natronincola peptidivorans]
METPILETERLILRPLILDDAEDVYRKWSSDPKAVKYMQWDLHTSINVTKEWLTTEEKAIDSDNHYNWGFVLKKTGCLIGSGGFYYNAECKMFEIGYIIMRQYWGQGITSEAAEKIISYAKDTLGINTLYGKYAKDNIASGCILEKLGFIYQNDGKYSKFSGSMEFQCKEYILKL